MGNSIYAINKGVNKSIEFKGLKAQYIWYFGAVVIALLILFALLYIIGINSFLCIGIVLLLGTVLTLKLYALSNRYGEHGMMKRLARRGIPKIIQSKNRTAFIYNK